MKYDNKSRMHGLLKAQILGRIDVHYAATV
jgi:hypothetical protein